MLEVGKKLIKSRQHRGETWLVAVLELLPNLTVRKSVFTDGETSHIIPIIASIHNTACEDVVRVLSFETSIPSTFEGKNFLRAHSYTMEQLIPLDCRERNYIHAITSVDDKLENNSDSYVRRFSEEETLNIINREESEESSIHHFFHNNSLLDYHTDLHEDNVMKTFSDGKYKLIDLESFCVGSNPRSFLNFQTSLLR